MSSLQFEESREAVSNLGRKMLDVGLTAGSGGNISKRISRDRIAISPSRIPYSEISPRDVPVIDLEGNVIEGEAAPSSETPMHTALYREREHAGGIVHTHSTFATVFATIGEPILPSYYQLAFVGREVPVARFELPGTDDLAAEVLATLPEEGDACLLQNHGVLTLGKDANRALENAHMVEHAAKIHLFARLLGEPILLDDADVETLLHRFQSYRDQAAY